MQHVAAQWYNSTRHWGAQPMSGVRRIWMMIPFGNGLEMLMLHLETLQDVVDHFLITESTTTHTRHESKAALLTEALTSGSVPPSLAAKVTVRVIDLVVTATFGHCSQRPVGHPRTSCIDEWQRYQLFDLLMSKMPQAEDLAVLADFDEIARPEVLLSLKQCFPFVNGSNEGRLSKVILEAPHFEFGMHCLRPTTWLHGPHVFSAGYLLSRFGPVQQKDSDGPISENQCEAASWSRQRMATIYSMPHIAHSAWHFSTFGSAAAIKQKFLSWSHSNTLLSAAEQTVNRQRTTEREKLNSTVPRGILFTAAVRGLKYGFKPNGFEHQALNEKRLERCAQHCLDPYPYPRRQESNQQTVPPCWATGKDATSFKMGKHLTRHHTEGGAFPPVFYKSTYKSLLFRHEFASSTLSRFHEL